MLKIHGNASVLAAQLDCRTVSRRDKHSANALIEFRCHKLHAYHIEVDLNLLVVFDTIYAEASITRASRRLNLSQPAISHALGRLREMVEDPLFTRHGRLMTPTPLARRMIEPIRQSLQGIEATLTKGDRFAPASAVKHFTVGMREALETAVLGKLMRSIAERAPRVTISTVRTERRELERELSAGTIDAAIDVLLPLPDEIRRERLRTEWLTVVARPRHPKVGPRLTLPHLFEPGAHRGLVAAPRLERGRLRAGPAEFAPPHSFAMPKSFGGVPGGQRNRPDLDDAATPRRASSTRNSAISWCRFRSKCRHSTPTSIGTPARMAIRPTLGSANS